MVATQRFDIPHRGQNALATRPIKMRARALISVYGGYNDLREWEDDA
jgi:hypothetical protein